MNAADWAVSDADDLRDTFCDIFAASAFEAPRVMLPHKSELLLNASDAKRHTQGVPVPGARKLKRGTPECRAAHDALIVPYHAPSMGWTA